MLSQKHLHDICLLFDGGYKQCRYSEEDSQTWKWYCVKLQKDHKAAIDKNVEEYLHECKKKGIDPKKGTPSLGDNCQGYVVLKYLEQGYDQP
jgi:hypothetical protein